MAALSTAYFLVRCKGALHPFDYEAELYEDSLALVPSLTELCCTVMVRDSGFTKRILSYLPAQIHYLLMKTAIVKGFNRAAALLLPTWPLAVFSLMDLWPHVFDNLQVLYDNNLRHEHVKNAVSTTTTLINSFIKMIKSDISQTLKILDLRGFPTLDRTVHYLCHEILTLSTNRTISEDKKYHIFIDCDIRDEDTCHQLLSALKLNQEMTNSKLHLHISKIDVSCIGEVELQDLLKMLNSTELTGLSLQFNSLGNTGFTKLLPILTKYTSITALDLSCNNLHFSQNEFPNAHSFSALTHLFPLLRRLDLSNNRLTNCLQQILPSNGLKNIVYLKLSAGILSESDIRHLKDVYSSVEGVTQLRELDLSENSVITNCLPSFRELLTAVTSSLQILEIEDCKFTDVHLPSVVRCALAAKGLRYLNLARHLFSSHCLSEYVPKLGSLQSLVCLRMAYAEDCYIYSENESFYLERKRILSENIDREVMQRTGRSLKIKWTELT